MFFTSLQFYYSGSMGLSLVGVGLVNLSTSDNGYGNAGDYNCDSLKDQSTLWMGVGVLVLTSFGLMASFWPGSTEDESSSGQPSQRARCCCRKAESPISLGSNLMEPLLTEEDGERQTIRDGPIMDDREHAPATNVEERNESTSRLRGTSRLLKLAGNQSLYLWVGIAVLLVRLPFSLVIPHLVATFPLFKCEWMHGVGTSNFMDTNNMVVYFTPSFILHGICALIVALIKLNMASPINSISAAANVDNVPFSGTCLVLTICVVDLLKVEGVKDRFFCICERGG